MVDLHSATYVADGDIRPRRFVKMDTGAGDDRKVLEADANERTVGISPVETNIAPLEDLVSTSLAAQAGQALRVHTLAAHCPLEAGAGGWSAGDLLKPDADGKGVPIATSGTTIQEYGARALTDAAAGAFGEVEVIQGQVRPALS